MYEAHVLLPFSDKIDAQIVHYMAPQFSISTANGNDEFHWEFETVGCVTLIRISHSDQVYLNKTARSAQNHCGCSYD